MSEIGHASIWGVDCICFEENDIITVAAKEKNVHFDFGHIQDRDFYIKYSNVIGDRIAKIDYVKSINGNIACLCAKYIYSRVINKEICKLEITGTSINDFFNPVFYFNNPDNESELNKNDYLHSKKEVDKWTIKYDNKDINIKLEYGNVLSHGICSDLRFKPIIMIEFPRTSDFDYVYCVFTIFKNTIKLIDNSNSVGDFKIKLISIYENHDSYCGELHICEKNKGYYERHIGAYNYYGYKQYIERFLQFSASFNYSITHFSNYGFRNLLKGYTNIEIANIFNSFEYECHANNELYEKKDSSIYSKIKNSMISKIEEIENNNLSEEEKMFLNSTKDEIERRGSTTGIKWKIINAYTILKKSLDSSINNIFYNPEYRLTDTISDKDIKKIANRLYDIRGSIFHGGYVKLTDLDTQKIRFLEIIVYSQMLLRMNFSENEIERIVGSVFNTNYIMTDELLKSKRKTS